MKKVTLLLAIIFIYTTTLSQSCLPDGITFSTQEQIDNFQTDYPGCTVIEGFVKIWGGSNNITNLIGLDVLTAIEGDLWIEINPFLGSLTGLDNITSIGGFVYLRYNASITDLTGLGNLVSIGGYLNIYSMESISSLSGLDNLTTIGSYLKVFGCPLLTDLSGLDNVTTVGGDLDIHANDMLTSLTGLENLNSVGLNIWIEDNDFLTTLSGLDNLSSAGGLFIEYNEILSDLTPLINLSTLGGSLRVKNNLLLTELTGLDNIDPESILHLYIYDNPLLPLCEVESVCDYLLDPDPNPNRVIQIYDNAPGCNTQEEVIALCTVGISDIHAESFTIYPNPATNELFISTDKGIIIKEINIYNQLGQKVLYQQHINNVIDVSMLQPGVYILELVSGNSKIREKLIIE